MRRFHPAPIIAVLLGMLVMAAPANGNGSYSSTEADPAAIRSLGFEFGVASGYADNLDRFYAGGLKTLVWLGGYSQSSCSWSWSDDKIRERIAEIKGHPGIYAYFLDDEPHAGPECPNTPDQVRARNALVKSLDPGTTTVITENRTDAFGPLANTTDVMGLVMYPCNYEDGCDWDKIPGRVAMAESAGVGRYWGVPQAFGDEYYRKPTPAEMQRIIDQWNATRAELDLAYAWDCCSDPMFGLSDAPELWDVWKRENARAGSFAPGALTPAPAKLAARFSARWRATRRYTRVLRLRVTRIAAGATLQMACRSRRKGCPFRSRRVAVRRGAANPGRLLRKRRLRPGAVLELRLSSPGYQGQSVRYTMRSSRRPAVTHR
jgi:hypothetical protein